MTVDLALQIIWVVVMPIVWWFAVPIIFRWYRSGDAFDIAISRVIAGFGGLVLAFIWPAAVAAYLLGRLVIWRTQSDLRSVHPGKETQ